MLFKLSDYAFMSLEGQNFRQICTRTNYSHRTIQINFSSGALQSFEFAKVWSITFVCQGDKVPFRPPVHHSAGLEKATMVEPENHKNRSPNESLSLLFRIRAWTCIHLCLFQTNLPTLRSWAPETCWEAYLIMPRGCGVGVLRTVQKSTPFLGNRRSGVTRF